MKRLIYALLAPLAIVLMLPWILWLGAVEVWNDALCAFGVISIDERNRRRR